MPSIWHPKVWGVRFDCSMCLNQEDLLTIILTTCLAVPFLFIFYYAFSIENKGKCCPFSPKPTVQFDCSKKHFVLNQVQTLTVLLEQVLVLIELCKFSTQNKEMRCGNTSYNNAAFLSMLDRIPDGFSRSCLVAPFDLRLLSLFLDVWVLFKVSNFPSQSA